MASYRLSKHPNGSRIVTVRAPHLKSVCVGIWVAVGSRFESLADSGASHFIEHLVFKGTRCRTAKEITQTIEGLGGYLNAYTSEEHTCYYAKIAARHFATAFDVLGDMMLGSSFAPQEIQKERQVIEEEIAMYEDQPSQQVLEDLNAVLWPNHPLGRSIAGTRQSLRGMDRNSILAFRNRHYIAPNYVVVIAGPMAHAEARSQALSFCDSLPVGEPQPWDPAPLARNSSVALGLRSKSTEQTSLAIGFTTPSRKDSKRHALRVLNTVLGENMSSRLFQTVREDHGLAYSIGSSVGYFDDLGLLSISAGLDTKNLKNALALVAKELKKIRSRAPGIAETQRAKDYLIGQLDLSLESSTQLMLWAGEQALAYGQSLPPEELQEQISKVQPKDISALAREIFRPETAALAVIGPLKSKKGLTEALDALADG